MQFKSVETATHNILAYRIIKNVNGRTVEHSNYDDDGETQVKKIIFLIKILINYIYFYFLEKGW